jgi:hypothetical protein
LSGWPVKCTLTAVIDIYQIKKVFFHGRQERIKEKIHDSAKHSELRLIERAKTLMFRKEGRAHFSPS